MNVIEFNDVFATYLAGDKYLVYHLNENLLKHIKKEANESNCCLIYDQLLKIKKEESTLNNIRGLIEMYGLFSNEDFLKIDQCTLIDILKMNSMNANEIDVLIACCKWVDLEVDLQMLEPTIENKQKTFTSLKFFISFTNMKAEEVGKFVDLKNFLNNEEIVSLFFHLFNKMEPLIIENKILRSKSKIYSSSNYSVNDNSYPTNISCKEIKLNANQRVFITSLETTFASDRSNVSLKAFENDTLLDLKYEIIFIENKLCFKFLNCFRVNEEIDYKLVFRFDSYKPCQLEFNKIRTFQLREDDYFFEFKLNDSSNYHCIKKINFCIPSCI